MYAVAESHLKHVQRRVEALGELGIKGIELNRPIAVSARPS
jgi:hypothetical protein